MGISCLGILFYGDQIVAGTCRPLGSLLASSLVNKVMLHYIPPGGVHVLAQ